MHSGDCWPTAKYRTKQAAARLATLERYLCLAFDYPDHLDAYHDPDKGNRRFVEFHNMREVLYGLVMLIVGRGSPWAREKGSAMLQFVGLGRRGLRR